MFSITQKTKFQPFYICEHRQRTVILKLSKIHSNIVSNTKHVINKYYPLLEWKSVYHDDVF
jgi:hypothetical protein